MQPVLVKGAGVAGLTVALELCRRGYAVEVVERASSPGRGASYYAGGMLAPFCEREAADEAVLKLGLQAADWWSEAVPGLVVRHGTLVVAQPRDTADLNRFAARTGGYRRLAGKDIAALEPSLAGRFDHGLFFEDEAHLDPRAALAALFDQLQAHDVIFHFGVSTPPSGRAYRCIIDCTGSAANERVSGLRGVRGEMIYLQTAEVKLSRPVRMLHPRHPIYIVPRENNRFMIGATMIESDDSGPITARSLMGFLNAAYALHPAFGEARLIETGTGIRPAFDDNLPRVIETPEGLAIAGMHRHGFLLSPAMARVAADRIRDRIPGSERSTA